MKWFLGILSVLLVLASVPLSIAYSKNHVTKANAAGVTMVVGLAFMTIFDPKTAQAIELIERRNEMKEESHLEEDV